MIDLGVVTIGRLPDDINYVWWIPVVLCLIHKYEFPVTHRTNWLSSRRREKFALNWVRHILKFPRNRLFACPLAGGRWWDRDRAKNKSIIWGWLHLMEFLGRGAALVLSALHGELIFFSNFYPLRNRLTSDERDEMRRRSMINRFENSSVLSSIKYPGHVGLYGVAGRLYKKVNG